MSDEHNDTEAPAPIDPVDVLKPKRKPKSGKGFKPFKKGEGGRNKGIPNRTTRVLKELIILAAHKTGSDGKGKDGAIGYLSWLARREPAVFGNLLGKVLPLQLQMTTPTDPGDDTKGRYTSSELRDQLIARGLRVPTLIDVTPEAVPSAQPEQQQEEEEEDVDTK